MEARDRKTLEDLLTVLDQRRATYRTAVASSLLGKDNTDRWANILTRINFTSHLTGAAEKNWKYAQAWYQSAELPVDQVLSIFEGALEGVFSLGEVSFPTTATRFQWTEELPSKDGRARLEWPATYFSIEHQSGTVIPGGPLVSAGAPVFVDALSLIKEEFRGEMPQGRGVIEVFLPNYRARLTSVRLGVTGIAVAVERGVGEDEVLLLKAHAIHHDGSGHHAELPIVSELSIVETGFMPAQAYVALISGRDGNILDFRRFGGHAYQLRDDVEVEVVGVDEIEALLLQGEGTDVEFKLKLGHGSEFAETVAAFANGQGGTILVGVDDKANVMGFTHQNPDNAIQGVIRQFLERQVPVRVEIVEVRGKTVCVIRVPQGANKPYGVRERGVIVRAGATDRPATPDELDSFYRSDASGRSVPDWWPR